MRAFIPIVANQALVFLLGLVNLKLITALIPPEVNGRYSLFQSLAQLGIWITHSGLINHATRFWQRERGSGRVYLSFLARAGGRCALPLAGLLAAVCGYQSFQTGEWHWWLLWLPLLIGAAGLAFGTVGSQVLMAAQRHWAVLGWSGASGVARTVMPILCVLWWGVSFSALAWGFAAHVLVFAMGWWWLAHSLARTGTDAAAGGRDWTAELRQYGRPFALLGLGSWFLQFGDRWIVEHFFDAAQVGYLDAALKLGGIAPTLAAGALMQWIFPKVFQRADHSHGNLAWQDVRRDCDRVTGVFVLVAVAGVTLTHGLAPWLVGTLVSDQYTPALSMVFASGFILINASINQFYYLVLQGQQNSRDMVKVMLLLALVKTAGGVICASISWSAFILWPIGNVVLSWLLGRWLIQRFAMKKTGTPVVPPENPV